MKAIVHVDRNWGIGKDNKLMFRLPLDMKFFKETTTGNVVVMGGSTLRSFPKGPLVNRVNIVLSGLEAREDCVLVRSIDELLHTVAAYDGDRVYLIGGASLYRELLPYCTEALVTKVDADGGADTFFPDLDESDAFVCVSESEPQETNGYRIRFCTYRNRAPRVIK